MSITRYLKNRNFFFKYLDYLENAFHGSVK